MEELFVSIPMSIRLKKLNFNKPCMRYMFLEDESNIITESLIVAKNWNEDGLCTSIPMRQQVLDWLYETHNVWIQPYIDIHPDTHTILFPYRIFTIKDGKRYGQLMVDGFNSNPNELYEQAIKQVLNRLEDPENQWN